MIVVQITRLKQVKAKKGNDVLVVGAKKGIDELGCMFLGTENQSNNLI